MQVVCRQALFTKWEDGLCSLFFKSKQGVLWLYPFGRGCPDSQLVPKCKERLGQLLP